MYGNAVDTHMFEGSVYVLSELNGLLCAGIMKKRPICVLSQDFQKKKNTKNPLQPSLHDIHLLCF